MVGGGGGGGIIDRCIRLELRGGSDPPPPTWGPHGGKGGGLTGHLSPMGGALWSIVNNDWAWGSKFNLGAAEMATIIWYKQ